MAGNRARVLRTAAVPLAQQGNREADASGWVDDSIECRIRPVECWDRGIFIPELSYRLARVTNRCWKIYLSALSSFRFHLLSLLLFSNYSCRQARTHGAYYGVRFPLHGDKKVGERILVTVPCGDVLARWMFYCGIHSVPPCWRGGVTIGPLLVLFLFAVVMAHQWLTQYSWWLLKRIGSTGINYR